MMLKKIVSEGLAHHSYFLSDDGLAAVIDPRRDVSVYLDLAREQNVRITRVFETHRNEDYVIGSLELARRCGAEIYHGTATDFAYGNPVKEGDRFMLGGLSLSILETPGHTLDSISVVVKDPRISEQPAIVFTGDALFAGDAGRTDFFGEEKAAWAAETLYESIFHKILRLGDGVLVCPAHGAGSVCGSEISALEYTTVGFEKETNPLLSLDRSGFVKRKVHEHHYLPPYFKMMEKLNQEGAPVISRIPDLKAYSSREFADRRKERVQVVDLRSPPSFGGGHIPGSISLWRDGIPSFAGWFLNYEDPILLVDDFNLDQAQVVRHFVRLGYDNLEGYLAGGFINWCKAGGQVESLDSWSVYDLHDVLEKGKLFLLDVRDINNRMKVGHILGSRHIYVGELPGRLGELPRTHHIAIYCDAGFKGCLAASLLQQAGFTRVANILGGMAAWLKAGFDVEK